jgi:hypothetical protein
MDRMKQTTISATRAPLHARLKPIEPVPTTPQPVSRWETAGRWVMVVGLLIGWPIAVNRAMHAAGTDFVMFCDNGRHIVEHGVRHPTSNLSRYWPSCDVPWVLLAYVPVPIGMTLWYALNVGSWYGLLRTIRTRLLAGASEVDRRQATLAAGLLALPLVVDGLCLGTFHVFMVWFMVAGLLRARTGHAWSGGALLGMAAWMKLLPVMGIGYLVWKRQFRPAAIAVVCMIGIDVVLSVAAFGPQQAWNEHVTWWQNGAAGTVSRQLTTERNTDEDRSSNQSMAVTMRRLLSPFGRAAGEYKHPVQILSLTGEQLKYSYYAVIGALSLAIAWFCRRSAWRTSSRQAHTEIALVVLATLWFSPVTWSYHPTAATAALAIILCRCTHESRTAWVVSGLWLLSIALLAWTTARWAGDLFWMSAIVGGVLVWTNRTENCHQPALV